MLHRRIACARLSHQYMTQSKAAPFNHNVHHRSHWTEAAYGCLKPPPTRRLRRAILHLSYSMTLSHLLDTTPPRRSRSCAAILAKCIPPPSAPTGRASSQRQGRAPPSPDDAGDRPSDGNVRTPTRIYETHARRNAACQLSGQHTRDRCVPIKPHRGLPLGGFRPCLRSRPRPCPR